MIKWQVSQEIRKIADDFYEFLTIPNFEAFSQVALRHTQGNPVLSEAHFTLYNDALSDLVSLLEESRFLAAIGWAYLQDTNHEFDYFSEEQAPLSMDGAIGSLLLGYLNLDNPPSLLFDNPTTRISKNRLIGPWFAASLIDSSIIRLKGVLDRIIALYVALFGLSLETFKDTRELKYPIASEKLIKNISEHMEHGDAKDFMQILHSESVEGLKLFRDKFLHRNRIETQLHGSFFFKLSDSEARLYRGLNSDDHILYVVIAHKNIVEPLIQLAKKYLPVSE